MRAPAFWAKETPGFRARLLAPAGALLGAITTRRMAAVGRSCGAPVICVGNLTAGGAGKTPLALAIAEILKATGETPVFLSRGYGGSRRGAPLRVDLARHGADLVGDEPLLLARVAPVIVGADRVAGAFAAVEAGASVVVMDDGMQNPALRKDLTLAAVDGGAGIGNGLCIPAGPLRAPVAAQLGFLDALVIVGEGAAGERVAAMAAGKPIFRAHLAPDPAVAARLRGGPVLAFAGIGRPEKFFATLHEIGASLLETRAFPDHHRFSPEDLATLVRDAGAQGARLATTEKDRARLPEDYPAVALPVRLDVDDAPAFENLVAAALARARRKD